MVLARQLLIASVIAVFCLSLVPSSSYGQELFERGKEIYTYQCADCHGEKGEGVEGAYESPLAGDLSKRRLMDYVEKTMPEGDAESCIGEEADAVTQYIMEAFYTREARLRNNPPTIAFSRLTATQYQNAVADVMRPFIGAGYIGEKRGLKAEYFKTRSHGKDKAFERIDDAIDFDFGSATPDKENFDDPEQFAISWSGSLIAPDTGLYEFILVTKNGARLFINDNRWRGTALIDNHVTDGTTEHRGSIYLRAGVSYPIAVTMFKFKDDAASIRLDWVPPHRPRETVGKENFTTDWAPVSLQLATEFPADDSSVGYERGTAVSPQWDAATTKAAVEVLEFVESRFNDLTGYDGKIRKAEKDFDEAQRAAAERERIVKFCESFTKYAFRRSLTEREKAVFLERPFQQESDPRIALQRVVLLTLKSPQFLYLKHQPADAEAESAKSNKRDARQASFAAAEKMAIGFWDSIPDKQLFEVAASGGLADEKTLESQAWRMLGDPRTRVKVREFFHHWLETERALDATKDPNAYPGFDEYLIAALRESLDRSIDEIIWSEESDFRKLFLSEDMYVDSGIADYYGIEASESENFVKVPFEPDRRAGILTHPYLMTGLSYHKNTSPIHRGVFVAKSLLGRSLKPPTIDVEPLTEDFDPTMTTRQRVAHQTSEIACQACHSVINPLGFSFENYDAVGRFRETEKDQKVDAAAEYETPDGEILQFNGAKDLAKFLVENESAHRNFIEQLFRYFAKQPLAAYGNDKIDILVTRFRNNEFNVRCLLVDMAKVVANHELNL